MKKLLPVLTLGAATLLGVVGILVLLLRMFNKVNLLVLLELNKNDND